MMVNPILYLIDTCFTLINYGLFAWIIIGLLINFNLLNAYHPVVRKIDLALTRIFEPILLPIRRYMPDLGGLDLSPVVLMVGLNFARYTVHWMFASLSF
jgi:YggT family protein